MCSIAGYFRFASSLTSSEVLGVMNGLLAHRGPDDAGLFLADGRPGGAAAEVPTDARDFPHRIGLAHNRFAIVDTSSAGHQPFRSVDGRWTMVFNGEIYNHRALRPELQREGWSFRSNSDTEVLLAAYALWGDRAFERMDGFWACAIWDNQTGHLTLCRDRFGEAPLFFHHDAGKIVFASEIAALRAALDNGMSSAISASAVSDYLFHGLTDLQGETFFDGIRHFPSASLARIGPDGVLAVRSYWRLPERRLSERELPPQEAVRQCHRVLSDAVALRLQADVLVGFQLSGGIDSALLVALAAGQGARLTAYTVSYPGTVHDEYPLAQAVAGRYTSLVEHREMRSPGGDFWQYADATVAAYGEPVHSPNIFTQQQIWQAMRADGIKVVVNGGAGDEVFAGYSRDYFSPFLRDELMRGRFGSALREASLFSEDPAPLVSSKMWRRMRSALTMGRGTAESGLVALSSPGSAVRYVPTSLCPARSLPPSRHEIGRTLSASLRAILGDRRLAYYCKIGNISSLAVPIEMRLPFLGREVVELAFTLPATYLIRDGWMKWILRKVAEPIVPPEVVWRRKKMGFPFPYEQWCRGSREAFVVAVGDTECPYIDRRHLLSVWDELAAKNPIFLWRCMNLCLWWRRCVEGRALGATESAAVSVAA